MRVLTHISALTVFALSACVSQSRPTSPPLSTRERLLLGTWRAQLGLREFTVNTRRADRTFTEESATDYPKPGTRFTCTGTWRVAGNTYYSRYLSVTDPTFREGFGNHRAHIHSLTETEFVFQYEGAPVVSEKRIKPPR